MDRAQFGILPHREAEDLFVKMNKDFKNNDELQVILSKLSTITYFNQFIEQYLSGSKNDQLMDLCSHLKMEKFQGGEVIIKEGEPSNNKLYIIFQGTCLMIRKKPMDQLQAMDTYQKTPALTQLADTQNPVKKGLFARKLTNQLFQLQAEKSISQQQKQVLTQLYGQPFKVLKKGEGFGEKALMHNLNRGLTVAANSQDLYLVILLKDDFQMIQKYIERGLKDKQELIFQIFRNVINEYSSARLDTMVYSFETVEYDKHTVLTVEDEKGGVFFIIQQGEVTITRSYKDSHLQQIPICVIEQVKGNSNLLGEEIVINKSKKYDYTATVTSTIAKIMVIDAVQFHIKFPVECKDQIIRDYKAKVSSRQQTYIKVIQNRQDNLAKLTAYQDTKVDLDAFSQLYQLRSKIKKFKSNKIIVDVNQTEAQPQFKGRIFKSFYQEGQQSTISAQTFNTNLSPTVGNYCIEWIVSKQNENYFKNNQNKSPTVIVSAEPYDFGKNELEDARQKQYIYEIRNNLVQALPKYEDRDQQLLTKVIKKRFLRSINIKSRSKDTLLMTTSRMFSRQDANSDDDIKNNKSSFAPSEDKNKSSKFINKTQASSPRNHKNPITTKTITIPINLKPVIQRYSGKTKTKPYQFDLG